MVAITEESQLRSTLRSIATEIGCPTIGDERLDAYACLGVEVCRNDAELDMFIKCCLILEEELDFDEVKALAVRYKACLHFVLDILYPGNLDKEERLRPTLTKITGYIDGRQGYRETLSDRDSMFWLIDKHPAEAENLFRKYSNAAKGLVFNLKEAVAALEAEHQDFLMELYVLSGGSKDVFRCIERGMLEDESEREELAKLARTTLADFPKILAIRGHDSLAELNDAVERYSPRFILDILSFTTDDLETERKHRAKIKRAKKLFLEQGLSEEDFFSFLRTLGDKHFPKLGMAICRSLPHFQEAARENVTGLLGYYRALGDRVNDHLLSRLPRFIEDLAEAAGPRTVEVLTRLRIYTALQSPLEAIGLVKDLIDRGLSFEDLPDDEKASRFIAPSKVESS